MLQLIIKSIIFSVLKLENEIIRHFCHYQFTAIQPPEIKTYTPIVKFIESHILAIICQSAPEAVASGDSYLTRNQTQTRLQCALTEAAAA